MRKFTEKIVLEAKASFKYEYGCVMLMVDFPDFHQIVEKILPDDVYIDPSDPSYGIEENPHVTLLYGLQPEVTTEQVKEVLKDFLNKTFDIQIIDISKFSNNDVYEVLKFGVIVSEELQNMYNRLKSLPHEEFFKTYNPHITIGYLHKGSADKYLVDYYNVKTTTSNITYSLVDGNKVKL